jgi:hypothetical protein
MKQTKKLIGFTDDILEKIEAYASENDISFSLAVRELVKKALNIIPTDEENSIDNILNNQVDELIKQVAELTKNYSYFQADDTQSKVGNLEVKTDELEKKLNVLTKVSKLFKSHISNRELHVQD